MEMPNNMADLRASCFNIALKNPSYAFFSNWYFNDPRPKKIVPPMNVLAPLVNLVINEPEIHSDVRDLLNKFTKKDKDLIWYPFIDMVQFAYDRQLIKPLEDGAKGYEVKTSAGRSKLTPIAGFAISYNILTKSIIENLSRGQ